MDVERRKRAIQRLEEAENKKQKEKLKAFEERVYRKIMEKMPKIEKAYNKGYNRFPTFKFLQNEYANVFSYYVCNAFRRAFSFEDFDVQERIPDNPGYSDYPSRPRKHVFTVKVEKKTNNFVLHKEYGKERFVLVFHPESRFSFSDSYSYYSDESN